MTKALKWQVAAALAFVFLGCSIAGCADPRSECADVKDPDRAIRTCTKIIDGGRETKHNVAIALFNRGIAHTGGRRWIVYASDGRFRSTSLQLKGAAMGKFTRARGENAPIAVWPRPLRR